MADERDHLPPSGIPLFCDPTHVSDTYPGAPTFDHELIAEDPSAPVAGVLDRYREVARLHAFGRTNNEICATLGYTPSRVSIILRDPFVQREIERWRQKFVDGDAVELMKQIARDGARRILGIVHDPKAKDETVIRATQMAVEQAHGKPKQSVEVTGTLQHFLEIARELREVGPASEASGPPKVGRLPDAAPQPDPLEGWLNQHLAPPCPP